MRARSRSHAYCLPSVIILGAMKAGTTELITWMQKHPAVQASRHELEFFSNDFIYNGEGTHAEVLQALLKLAVPQLPRRE